MALGRVIKQLGSPANTPFPVTWDGRYLWVGDRITDFIYQVNPITGTWIPRFAAPNGDPRGMTWDGSKLWIVDLTSDAIDQVDPTTGAIVHSFPTPTLNCQGLAWDGENLWTCSNVTGLIYQLSPVTGTTIRSFAAPGPDPRGLTWGGDGLWHSDTNAERVYKLNPVTGAVLCSFVAPFTSVADLAWDGEYLWLVDQNDLIYQIEVTPSIIASAIRALGPIGQWGLWEAGGAVAYDISGNSPAGERNGTHVGITPANAPGPGDGSMAPFYDGALDYTDIWTPGFRDAFNGAEGSIVIYPKVNGIGVWTDGAERRICTLAVDGNNIVLLRTPAANNTLQWRYVAGGVVEQRTRAGVAALDYMALGISWSALADEVIAYYNNLQEGAIMGALGVWVGNLAVNQTVIGASSTVPGLVWHGWESQGAVFDRPLTPTEFAGLPRGGP